MRSREPGTIRAVIQPESGGCGIASAAALSGMSYAETKRVATGLGIDVKDPRLWNTTGPMRRLLAAVGVNAKDGERAFTTWEALPNRAVLAIKWHLEKGVPHWHWVVFVREGGVSTVLDPATRLKTCERRDFGRMKPKWFIETV